MNLLKFYKEHPSRLNQVYIQRVNGGLIYNILGKPFQHHGEYMVRIKRIDGQGNPYKAYMKDFFTLSKQMCRDLPNRDKQIQLRFLEGIFFPPQLPTYKETPTIKLQFFYGTKSHEAFFLEETFIEGTRVDKRRTKIVKTKKDKPDVKYAFLYVAVKHMYRKNNSQMHKMVYKTIEGFIKPKKEHVMGLLMALYLSKYPGTKEEAIKFYNESVNKYESNNSL